jgi:hypothetical protein
MLIAKGDKPDGGKMLFVGLEETNMRKLAGDQPIYKTLGEIIPELDGWTLVIMGPEDMARFVATFGKDDHDGH